MESGRISPWQFFQLIVSLVIGLSLLQLPPVLTDKAGTDTWLAMLIAVILDWIMAAALYALGRRFPRRTLFEYPSLVLGRVLGKLTAVAYISLFVWGSVISIFMLAEFFKLVLPETPLTALVLLVTVVSSVGAYYGLETAARSAEIAGPLSLAVTVLIVLLGVKDMDFGNLLPILGNGLKGPVQASLVVASWFGMCVVMGVFMAYHYNPEQAFVAKASGILIGAAAVTMLVLASIAMLGPVQAARLRTPIWSTTGMIAVGEFFERLQILFVGLAIVADLVTLSVLHYASSLGLAQVFGLREYRPLVLPVGLILTALATGWTDSDLDVIPFLREAFVIYALAIELGLTYLVFLVAWLRGSRASLPRLRQRAEERAGDG